MLAGATASLKARQKEINDLNVFPVPDGDTGTNMYLTMKSVIDRLSEGGPRDMQSLAREATHAALLGARGNSGVILSQIIRGWFEVLGAHEEAGPREVIEAFVNATDVAYRAVRKPVEGTMLTVIRDVANAGRKLKRKRNLSLEQLFETYIESGEASVRKTPELLKVLKDAGVVDAGGFGLVVMLRGMLAALRGEEPEVSTEELVAITVTGQEEEITFTYCTELLVGSSAVPRGKAESFLEALGDSILVVSDDVSTRVHVHTDEPGKVMEFFQQYGPLLDVRVNNMREQAKDRSERLQKQPVAAVVVSNGPGLNEIFRSLGASVVVNGGDTLNPSTEEILSAIEEAPSDTVVFLPNNKNIIMAAEQAAVLTEKNVYVVPSRTLQQGIQAMLAFDPSQETERMLSRMERALGEVVSIGITRAVRNSVLKGSSIRAGEYLGIVEEKIVAHGPDLAGVVARALEKAVQREHSFITVFFGGEAGEEERRVIEEAVASAAPDLDLEIKEGGQSHYDALLALE